MEALREIFRPVTPGVLLALLGACVVVAVAWFVWNRVRALAWLVKAVYAVAPHAEFFDMRQRLVHGWGGVEASVFLVVVGYGVVYSAAFLLVARFLFNRQRKNDRLFGIPQVGSRRND